MVDRALWPPKPASNVQLFSFGAVNLYRFSVWNHKGRIFTLDISSNRKGPHHI
jgi:hypothetical protein